MENAGRGCFDEMVNHGCRGPVVICCGPGNNGGDGFVIARHLDNAGISTRVVLLANRSKFSGDALLNLETIKAMDIEIVDLLNEPIGKWKSRVEWSGEKQVEWIVDALLGTGAVGKLRSPLDEFVKAANSVDAKRLAIDIPSGMDCDTGECFEPTFEADLTCTFVAHKMGFRTTAAANLGEVKVIDIGAPKEIVERVRSAND